MKKSLLSAALFLLAACAKQVSPVRDSGDIRFSADMDLITKSEVVDLSNLGSFKVSAVASEGVYFKDMSVKSSDGGKTWTSEMQYKWPVHDLTFYAVSRDNGTLSIKDGKCRVEGFTAPAGIDDQQDFVVASAFSKSEGRDKSAAVNLAFHHATAGVSVKASNGKPDSYIVKVYGVKYGNLRPSDNLTVSSDGTAPKGADWDSWSTRAYSESTSTDYKVLLSEPVVLGSDARLVSGDKNLFLVPQCRDRWKADSHATCTPENMGAYISLLVNITTAEGFPVYPSKSSYRIEGVNAAWTSVGLDLELLPGYTNTFTLNFFKDGGAGQEDPEEPEDEDHGGDPILGGPINVAVAVDAWAEGENKVIEMK